MHTKAAKIAMIIAQEQQTRGAYRVAHQLLFSMRQQLRANGIYVPAELEELLLLLHSYIIVKVCGDERPHDTRATRPLARSLARLLAAPRERRQQRERRSPSAARLRQHQPLSAT